MGNNKNAFDRFINWLNNVENSFVNLIAKIIPILVPLIPAYVSYNHVEHELGFSPFFALTYASVVEGLGYASIYKALQFWEWNRRFTKEEKKSPFWLALSIYVSYLFVILWVNVMLDWQTGVIWYRIVAVGAISLLSVPAGLLISISAIHNERVREHDEKLEQLKEAREEAKRIKEDEKRKKEEKELEKENRLNNNNTNSYQNKKLSKSERAYAFVRGYYETNGMIPTNQLIVDNAEVSLGTAHSSIKTFKLDYAEELLAKGLVTQEELEKLSGSEIHSNAQNPIDEFISRNGRFPNTDELTSMGVSIQDAAKYVQQNETALIDNGILDSETVEKAKNYQA